MAKRRAKKVSGARSVWLAGAIAIALIAGFFVYRHLDGKLTLGAHDKTPIAALPERVEPANDGARVKVTGLLASGGMVRDPQLGVSAHAAALWREAEMLQWQEHCSADSCSYDKVWSPSAIDSRAFRHPEGHQNPPLRLPGAKFDAPELRLGAYGIDPALLEGQLKPSDLPVRAADLPPNLAASFSERDGVLYAGGDPAHPDVGTVRVRYRTLPLSTVTLQGVQKGKRLTF